MSLTWKNSLAFGRTYVRLCACLASLPDLPARSVAGRTNERTNERAGIKEGDPREPVFGPTILHNYLVLVAWVDRPFVRILGTISISFYDFAQGILQLPIRKNYFVVFFRFVLHACVLHTV